MAKKVGKQSLSWNGHWADGHLPEVGAALLQGDRHGSSFSEEIIFFEPLKDNLICMDDLL